MAPDPDELVEVAPGVTKRLGDCTVGELRAVVHAMEAKDAELEAEAEAARAVLSDMEAKGGDA